MSIKIRTTVVALVASISFAAATVAPAVSQAQWHTICFSGHCTTHKNFTTGGVDPCAGAKAGYDKAYEALLEAIQTKKEEADKVNPEMTQAEAQAAVEEAEAQVHLASIAAFEWGCDVAAHTSPASVHVVSVGVLRASATRSASHSIQAAKVTSSARRAL